MQISDGASPRDVMAKVKTIALVGASPKPQRDSHRVMSFLLDRGYQVVPVNPGQAGKEILGQPVYASLAEVPGRIDMVDIFRNSEAALDVVREALAEQEAKKISVIWMQLGVINDEAKRIAEEAGLHVVMDRCPKIELAAA